MYEEAKLRHIEELAEKALIYHEAAKQVQSSTNLPIEQCIELVKTAEISLVGYDIKDSIFSIP